MASGAFQTALNMSQMLLSAKPAEGVVLTRDIIAESVDSVISLFPVPEAERQILIAELEARFSIFIGSYKVLGDDSDHIVWLPTHKGNVNWKHWSRYRIYLAAQGMAPSAIDRLDELTDDVLGRLENPARVGSWSRRGMVVGHVQSGKTANYTGLICKAADAGYKLVVVLAGMHKNLRAQTQIRLDEGFLGYVSSPPAPGQTAIKSAGVGQIDPSVRPDSITNRRDDGDFKKAIANQFNVSPGGKPLLFVIKKNGSVLKHLLDWVDKFALQDPSTGHRTVRDLPLLVIDDEADQGSVDTNQLTFTEDGQLDEEHNPTIINRRIRRLLHAFEKNAYIGYTATPFANIYIHEQARTAEEGEDLFPRSFIVNMPVPSNYIGPAKLFGQMADEDSSASTASSLIRHVDDHVEVDEGAGAPGWMPLRHKATHIPHFDGERKLPASLVKAMHSFVLASAARRVRGQDAKHHSMLVHVTRFTKVQQEVFDQVVAELTRMKARWRNGDGGGKAQIRDEMKSLWESDFVPTSDAAADERERVHGWEDIEPMIWPAIEKIQVRQINGTSSDLLAYEEHQESGLSVIAVGGDKLSRGLTLEGLMVSYFLRASRMYDTLMQMGRWFGYRPGYADLCRMYMTSELQEWYEHIAEASEELREQFDHMVALGQTPRDYGLRVCSHPVLLVTSRVKSRNGVQLKLSYSGDVSETVAFHVDASHVEGNASAATRLIEACGTPHERGAERQRGASRESWPDSHVWRNVPSSCVLEFVRGYTTHPKSHKANRDLLVRYISEQNKQGELISWTVALLSGGESLEPFAGYHVRRMKRTPKEKVSEGGYYRIGRLLSPKDEGIDLDENAWVNALRFTTDAWNAEDDPEKKRPTVPTGPAMRKQRKPESGLLLLYLLDQKIAGLTGNNPVIGVGLSFPESATDVKVSYTVNNVYYEQEFGAV